MAIKNLKHGISVSKRDVVLMTNYVVMLGDRMFPFDTKLEAINFISEIISKDNFYKTDITLIKVELIKF